MFYKKMEGLIETPLEQDQIFDSLRANSGFFFKKFNFLNINGNEASFHISGKGQVVRSCQVEIRPSNQGEGSLIIVKGKVQKLKTQGIIMWGIGIAFPVFFAIVLLDWMLLLGVFVPPFVMLNGIGLYYYFRYKKIEEKAMKLLMEKIFGRMFWATNVVWKIEENE